MKKTLLFAFLFFTGMLSAQIVNIPDAAFKAKLLSADVALNSNGSSILIDTNNDSEIQVSEALAVYTLNLSNFSSPNLDGISAFSNLKELYCTSCLILTVDVTALTNLEKLEFSTSNVTTSINVSGLQNLKKINISGCSALTSFSVSGLAALQQLYMQGNINLEQLSLTGSINLQSITLSGKLETINLTGLVNLEIFRVTGNGMHLKNIVISSLPALKIFDISLNQVEHGLDFSASPLLEYLNIGSNQVPSLILGFKPELYSLRCFNNHLTALDLSGCPVLESVYAHGNDIAYLNLKNGTTAPESLTIVSSTDPQPAMYICIDEGEETYIQNNLSQLGLGGIPFLMNSYCSFNPGGNYNTISGTFTFDGDNNGCTSSDAAARNIKVGINDGIQTGTAITNISGNYNFYTQDGNFTLTPQFENNWFTATPPTATVNFADNNNNTATQNFCIAPNGVHPDVEVVLVPQNGAQPGFDARYQIVFKNKGNQALSGSVVLNYDEAILDYVALGSTAPTSTASGQLAWSYSNLLPFEGRTINVTLKLNGPMETPPVNLDDVLNYTVSISPATGDETSADNAFNLSQIVTGSYDPNDITCLEGDTVHPDKIGDHLHYNINFENTGTAPATFIVVKDVINPQQYDIGSLQMLHASHNVETRINGNKVEFFFDDINLAPLAKGNVVFKIKTKPTVAVNSTVMNKAEIFFDYNWPIVTNEAESTFAVLSEGDFAADNSVSIYPNPAITNVSIKASSAITSVQLYDIQGRLLIATNNAILDVSDRASGIYFVKVITEKGMKVEKLVRK